MEKSRKLVFWSLLILAVGIPLVLLFSIAKSRWTETVLPWAAENLLARMTEEGRRDLLDRLVRDSDLFGPEIIEHAMQQMSEDEKEALYDRMAGRVGSWYDVLAEPDVARIAKRHQKVVFRGADVVTNNVGMRSSRPFSRKRAGVFRIVCLGDSMVFGAGGPEEDRFCDQLEQYYEAAGVRVGGRAIETYAVGLGSWSMLNEGAYLGSRITDYDPDLVIVLTVDNDISDTLGVTGGGILTRGFSPENRALGTAVFMIRPPNYDSGGVTALMTDLSPEARRRWARGMTSLKRLEDLQQRRGEHILFSVLDRHRYFTEIFLDHARRYDFQSPVISTRFRWPGEDTVLPHDPHPNRAGHAILAHHYVHALSAAKIIPVGAEKLPDLHDGLSAESSVPADTQALEKLRSAYVRRFLKTRLDFDRLEPGDLKAYLGGFFPEQRKDALRRLPFASIVSGFLLRRPPGDPKSFELVILVPDYPELYPFELEVSLQGRPATTFRLEDPDQGGRHTIVCEVPPLDTADLAVEVMLRTRSYRTTMGDDRMKSFYLVSARLR